MTQVRIVFFLILFSAAACSLVKTGNDFKDQTLLDIDGTKIPAKEFTYVYEKNNFNNDSIYSENDVRNYLNLFINFKLKVLQAKEEGIDTTQSFIDEFESYQSELIKPYLLETKETDSLAKEAYERLQYFIHASHILVRVQDQQDTTEAYNKILSIKNELEKGSDFGELARNKSEDPSAKNNGGDLGYFTAFRMVLPFEDAAYNTNVGGTSEIFRSQFGYHILRVNNKEPNQGKVRIAHIVLRVNYEDSTEVKNKIFEIYEKLETGGDWNYFCQQFSEDERTKSTDGEINMFGQGQLPIQFKSLEDAAFSLDSVGQIAGPIESPMGWHIIKLLEKKPPETYEELEESLKQQVSRGERSQLKDEIVYSRLKSESGFSENLSSKNVLDSLIDSLKVDPYLLSKQPVSVLDKELFEIDGISYSIGKFADHTVMEQNKRSNKKQNPINRESYRQFVHKELLGYERKRIAAENFDYRMLEKEYYEGLLLFEVMEKYVWGKASSDTAGIKSYFDANREKYKWGERVKASLVSTEDKDLLPRIREEMKSETLTYYSREVKNYNNELSEQSKKEAEKVVREFSRVPESKIIIEYDEREISQNVIDSLVELFENKNVQQENIETISNNELPSTIKFSLISHSKKVLEYIYNLESSLTVNVTEGIFEKGDQETLSKVKWEPGITEIEDSDRFYFVKIDSLYTESFRDLSEIRGNVISDYQNELEKNWIADLKQKFPVSVNEDVLNKTLKYFEKK